MMIENKNRILNYGDFVRVYWNFHKKTFSIQKKIDGRWLVCGYSNNFMLMDAAFKVNEKGRQKVLKERRKNVHAWVYGNLAKSGMGLSCDHKKLLPAIIKYNPYHASYFYNNNLTVNEIKVNSALCVKFTNGVVSASYLN